MKTATNEMKHGLAITEHKGFNMTFEHGTSISVQFGKGNYASNRDDQRDPKDAYIYGSGSAEICIWNAKNEDLVNKFDKGKSSDGLVIGWCNPEYVAKAIVWTAKYDAKQGKKMLCMSCEEFKDGSQFTPDDDEHCAKCIAKTDEDGNVKE